MQRWAWTHRYAVPMFVASLVAVVLSGSGLVAVMVFANGGGENSGNTNGGEPSTNPGSEPSGDSSGGGIDPCVVGTWRVVSYTENSALGSAEMVEGTPVFTFEPDGTGVADFLGVRLEAEVFGGIRVDAGVDGQITYQWQTAGDTFEFVDQESTAEFSSELDIPGHEDQLTMPTGPLDYTCDGEAMTIDGEKQDLEYERSG